MSQKEPSENKIPEALWIQLHGQRIALCLKCADGRNKLVFSPEYISQPCNDRMTLTLGQLANPNVLAHPQSHHHRLAPVLSNLLPEGVLRDCIVRVLKIHTDDEFALLAATGKNLPGAVTAVPVQTPLPNWVTLQSIAVHEAKALVANAGLHFSLSGVQMKFSGSFRDGRYRISDDLDGEQWIFKTPSMAYPQLPANEYSAMKLAEVAGIAIPEIRLLPLASLGSLPALPMADETYVYAIKRFDRGANGEKIHIEDFAQVFNVYAHDKYGRINYEQIGRVLLQYSTAGIADVCEMAKRLLVNILLANGDAHIKNWSLVYPDGILPRLSPAYDIVSTLPYVPTDEGPALNMARTKDWRQLSLAHFERWAQRIGAPWQLIKTHLMETLEKARSLWPVILKGLPMDGRHQAVLKAHVQKLHADFRF